MIAQLVLTLLAQAGQIEKLGYGAEPSRDPAPLIDPRPASSAAKLEFVPANAEVGEPLELVLTAPHAADERIEVDDAALREDLAWVLFDEPTYTRADTSTRVVWKLARLEAGDTGLPDLRVDAVKGAERRALLVGSPQLAVASVLGPNEDAPRAPIGFRDVTPELSERTWWPSAVAAGVALLIAGAFLGRWLALRKRPRAATPPTTLERIAALGTVNLDDADRVRELHFELAHVLREHFDSAHDAPRAALSDDEWLRSVASHLTPERLSVLADVLRDAELVKYGAAQPTQWAVRETLDRARELATSAQVATERAA